jgi:hypothetical protein
MQMFKVNAYYMKVLVYRYARKSRSREKNVHEMCPTARASLLFENAYIVLGCCVEKRK